MITAKPLINAKFASSSANTEYSPPVLTKAIIDKFTIVNTDTVTQSISVNIVPSGGSVSDANVILKSVPINAGACFDSVELRNQILNTGDFISVQASIASKLSIRASGREVS